MTRGHAVPVGEGAVIAAAVGMVGQAEVVAGDEPGGGASLDIDPIGPSLASLLLSYRLGRASTRLMGSPKVPWWPGSIKTRGRVHVHQFVFGVVLTLPCRACGDRSTIGQQ
jgi:hypothetical protein